MQYTSIYENYKPKYFFIAIDNQEEWEILQPYFILTDIDHTNFRSIRKMDCLISNKVWYGKQRHGYGYSSSTDVYQSLFEAIRKLHGNNLTEEELEELRSKNDSDEKQTFSPKLLEHLKELNNIALQKKYERR